MWQVLDDWGSWTDYDVKWTNRLEDHWANEMSPKQFEAEFWQMNNTTRRDA